jgi:hypothetical protein
MRWLLLLCACAPSAKNFVVGQGDGGRVETDAGEELDAGPTCGCTRWSAPRDAGTIPSVLDELSGLVTSRSQPGVIYAHNDSGDSARFFALSTTTAQVLETFTLTGATANDWEDITIGPCGAETCVYLGDIGDNALVRTDYAVYRVVEPHVTSGTTPVTWERLPFQYPSGAKHNAESMFMHPLSGTLYIVTKEATGHSSVYRFPSLDPTTTVTLQLVAELTVPGTSDGQLTGADVNVCGSAVLLRMYSRLVELRLPEDATSFEDIFSETPVDVPFAAEDQGEAVAYSPNGMGYFTSSESPVNPATLSTYSCR